MNQPLPPPIRLPGERKTAIMELKVSEMLSRLKDRVANFYSDGVFPGTKDLPPNDRLLNYSNKTNVADIPLLANSDYADLFKAGQAPPLQSPFWVNALSVPDTFKEMQADFIKLLSAHAEKLNEAV